MHPPPSPIKEPYMETNPRPPLEILLRHERPPDLHFILSSWKWSQRSMHPELESPIYFRILTDRINHIRTHPSTITTVACDPDDENFIFGYACTAGPILHYVFVRQAFRQARVASRLVPLPRTPPRPVTAWSRAAELYSRSHPGAFLYEPTRILRRAPRPQRSTLAATPEVVVREHSCMKSKSPA